MKRYLIFIVFFSFLLKAQVFPLSPNDWNNKDFVKRFLGEYGVLTDLEPKIQNEELEVFKKLAELLKANQIDKAIKLLVNFENKYGKKEKFVASYFTLAQLYVQKGEYKKASIYLKKAIKAFPNFYRAYKVLALSSIEEKKYDDAYKYIIKSLELKGGDGDVYGFLGYLSLIKEQYFTASKAYEFALLYQVDNPNFKKGLVKAFMQMGEYKKAIAILDELINQDKNIDNYLLNQSNAYLALKDYDKALANLYIAKLLGNKSQELFILLGNLYLQKGLYKDSISSFKESFRYGKKPKLEYVLAPVEIILQEGSIYEVKDYFNFISSKYSSLDTKSKIKLWTLKSKIFSYEGKYDQAAKILKKIINIDPINVDVILELAKYYFSKKDYIQADIYCKRSYYVLSKRYKAFLTCANINIQKEDYKTALDLFSKAYNIKKSDYLLKNINNLKEVLSYR